MKCKLLTVLLIVFSNILFGQSDTSYLRQALNSLHQVKAATYNTIQSASAPGDTIEFVAYNRHVKEYINPVDKFIGSGFAWFQVNDTSRMEYCYDGLSRSFLDWNEKTVKIDSFQNNRLPFRAIGPPFFNYCCSIIKYALETTDSIKTEVRTSGDSVHFSLLVYNKVVEFFGPPVYSDISDFTSENIVSQYDLWFNKSDNLPYRLRRKMPHNISWEVVSHSEINKNSTGNFIASGYFPPGFSIESSGVQKAEKTDLEGKVAPALTLKDVSDHEVSVSDLNCRIIMLEFTGVGCGPCHSSIPFLKQLDNEYNDDDFTLISIETWSKNINGLKRYIENNGITYRYLLSTDSVNKRFHVGAVPAFYILDEKRVIRKIINGYKKGTTDQEIRDAINGLL